MAGFTSDLLGTRALLIVAMAAVAWGCKRDDIQVYKIANDSGNERHSATVPAGWETAPPGEMRVASFKIKEQGKMAEVSVVPLAIPEGREADNVNRWRAQVGMPPVTAADLPKISQAVPVGSETGQLFEQAGANSGSGDQERLLVAVTRYRGRSWFFKISGDDALVQSQKPAFLEYIKNYEFPGESQTEAATMPGNGEMPAGHPAVDSSGAPFAGVARSGGTETSGNKPDWQVPAGWTETSGGPFLVAKYLLTGESGGQASVNISSSGGTGGGLLMNVNRWRGQLGLNPVSDPDLTSLARQIDVGDAKGTLVEMSGTDARSAQPAKLTALVVPHGDQTWFYKLMGEPKLVDQNKDAFLKFAQTAKYH